MEPAHCYEQPIQTQGTAAHLRSDKNRMTIVVDERIDGERVDEEKVHGDYAKTSTYHVHRIAAATYHPLNTAVWGLPCPVHSPYLMQGAPTAIILLHCHRREH